MTTPQQVVALQDLGTPAPSGVITIELEDGAVQLDAARLEDFAARLRRHRTVRVDHEALWVAFHAAFPNRPPFPAERRWLLAALLYARDQGAIALPAERGPRWDRSTRPVLPRSVDRLGVATMPVDASWRQFPWHPALAWVPELDRLTGDALPFLQRVHEGLVRDEFTTHAPLKYRSLALTGDEKRLGQLAAGTLFGPGRLTYQLLGCLPDVQPIAWEDVGDARAALVFENAEPFLVALTLLRAMPTAPYGVLAWGHGTSVAQSIQWLGRIGRPITTIHYVGDLDRPGLDAAQSADRQARGAGLPPVEPAPGLHEAMFAAAAQFGHPDGWPYETPGQQEGDAARVQFLPEHARDAALRMLARGRRIPEEVLGPAEMRAAWCRLSDAS